MKKLLISLILLNVVGCQSVKADASTGAMDALSSLQQFVTKNTANQPNKSQQITSINDSISKIKTFITNNVLEKQLLDIKDQITSVVNNAKIYVSEGHIDAAFASIRGSIQPILDYIMHPTMLGTCVATCREDMGTWTPNTHGETVTGITKDACNAKLYSDKNTCNPISVVWYGEKSNAQTMICNDYLGTNKCTQAK